MTRDLDLRGHVVSSRLYNPLSVGLTCGGSGGSEVGYIDNPHDIYILCTWPGVTLYIHVSTYLHIYSYKTRTPVTVGIKSAVGSDVC